MEWVDLKRFAVAVLLFSVLDGTIGRLLGWERNEIANMVLEIGYVIVSAIRDQRPTLDPSQP